jgi:hypothetical protein
MREEQVKQVVDAKRQIAEGSLEIWNARLDLLRSVGDIQGLLTHLRTPAEVGFLDNCDCDNHCGEAVRIAEAMPPATHAKR